MRFERQVREAFPDLQGRIYMNTASYAAGCAPAARALADAAQRWAEGRFDYTEAEAAGERARTSFARLIGAPPDTVALIPTVSAVAGLVAAHLALSVPPGNVVVGAAEFTSNLFPWRMLEGRGWEVRLVEAEWPHVYAFARAVDTNTRLVAASAVQSATGYRADLGALREIANRSNALLFVDASQCAGALPIDMGALEIDALAAPSHKFLLGTRGFGYGAFAPALRDAMVPILAGWKAGAEPLASFYGPAMQLSPTASRFDLSVAWFNALAEAEAMALRERLGIEQVHRHNEALAAHMRDALIARAIPFADHGPRHQSTIFATAPTNPRAEERLREAGVVASMRAGRVRLSLHLYNTPDEIETVVELLTL